MTTGHVFIATSLDGFIARDNGDIHWLLQLDSKGEDHGYDEFMANIDVIIMGRGTYESIKHIQSWFYHRPVIVLSKTLAQETIPDELIGKVYFLDLSPKEIMNRLESEGHHRAYIDGGKVIQSFISDGLINDLIITKIPILLGSGRPLFGEIPNDIHLRHIQTTTFSSGFVQSHYEIQQ
ncbi:dihydrofolate reductase family protein [Providencia alcalifaciens]|uniref:dihydrofolate reductase family protein n=1 Tax=Providencia alcalifaciens TaxID=126385 RepID=UPI00029BF0CE|nr:bifunctional deaminase-reductase, C-terminal [Providencia alcalifaciens Dmel2]